MFENRAVDTIDRAYRFVFKIGDNLQSAFLFLLRLTWGLSFFHAGMGKFAHMTDTIVFFTSLGLPLPALHAYLVAFFETVGGACLVLGFGSRFAALPLIFIMFGAYGTAHVHVFKHFAFVKNPALLVQEAPFPYLITALTVFIFGPGRISLDGWIKRASTHWPKL